MSFSQLESHLQQATKDRRIPGIVVAAANASGSFDYLKTFGPVSQNENAPPIEVDSVFSLASASKLITNVAAMQCIEKGLISLDTEIADILPQWRNPKVFKGVDADGKALLEQAKSQITFAQLLTHTSGIPHLDNWKMQQYYAATGRGDILNSLMDYFKTDNLGKQEELLPALLKHMTTLPDDPLLFEPGEGWVYGHGQDWAGQIIEKLTGLSLEDYCQKHIFQPLEMKATFHYGAHPELASKLVPVMTRRPDASLTNTPRIYPAHPQTYMGGSGMCCSAPEYMKLLRALLLKDGKILKSESIDLLLGYRLPNAKIMETDEVREDNEEIPRQVRIDHSLAGLVNLDTLPATGRHPGSSSWAGATGVFWWVDADAGLCGFYGSQVMLVGDKGISRGMFEEFEKTVYQNARSEKGH